MNSKVRCKQCRQYFDRTEAVWFNTVQHICSDGCLAEFMAASQRHRPPPRLVTTTPRKPRKPRQDKVPVEMRFEVKARDGCCRWCGHRGTQVHHIQYRSQGGKAVLHNLIALCADCHRRAHSSKEAFQPLLLGYIWLLYAQGVQMTIPEVAALAFRRGWLTDLQRDRLAG